MGRLAVIDSARLVTVWLPQNEQWLHLYVGPFRRLVNTRTPTSRGMELIGARLTMAAMAWLHIRGTDIHYLEFGTVQPLLFLHGNGSSGLNWHQQDGFLQGPLSSYRQ